MDFHHTYELFAVIAEACMVITFHVMAHRKIRGALPAGFSIAVLYLAATSYYLWLNIAPTQPGIV
jgi:hypothetical protein